MLPCLIFEDEHLLVVHKPAGLNTHSPSPYAGEGIYEWLRHREPRWAQLAIIHRVDKETSGVLVFARTPLANRSLTAQFTARTVRKRYLLLTDRSAPREELVLKSALARAGEKYLSRPAHAGAEIAETRFRRIKAAEPEGTGNTGYHLIEAEPLTGRTHQIRVHAAEAGMPILGDTLYGGTPAARVYLHAAELTLRHPASGKQMTFRAPLSGNWGGAPSTPPGPEPRTTRVPEGGLPCLALRAALIDANETNAFRLVHGASDGWPGWYVDQLGEFLLSQSAQPLDTAQRGALALLARLRSASGVYQKILTRQVRRTGQAEASPRLILGNAAPQSFVVRENSLQFELSFGEGYSVGLFLDQRDNRRRLLTGHIAAGFPLSPVGNRPLAVLNVFAYTCGFSVCAAKAGMRTTSLDLSRRWLEWGKRNFLRNAIDPSQHDFIYGDAFDWLQRLAKKQRQFDVVVIDPPTFSQSKATGVFRAEKDYSRLVKLAVRLLTPDGLLFVSTNAADWPPEKFLAAVTGAVHAAGRSIIQQHYVPQPPDFPISRTERGYLKTAWFRLGSL